LAKVSFLGFEPKNNNQLFHASESESCSDASGDTKSLLRSQPGRRGPPRPTVMPKRRVLSGMFYLYASNNKP